MTLSFPTLLGQGIYGGEAPTESLLDLGKHLPAIESLNPNDAVTQSFEAYLRELTKKDQFDEIELIICSSPVLDSAWQATARVLGGPAGALGPYHLDGMRRLFIASIVPGQRWGSEEAQGRLETRSEFRSWLAEGLWMSQARTPSGPMPDHKMLFDDPAAWWLKYDPNKLRVEQLLAAHLGTKAGPHFWRSGHGIVRQNNGSNRRNQPTL